MESIFNVGLFNITPNQADFRIAKHVTLLTGFFASVVYTRRRVPHGENYGYQEEVS